MIATREIAAGWVWSANVRALVRLLSLLVGYRFDHWDWDAVSAGLAATDEKRADGWFAYPLAGTPQLEVRLANSPGSDVVNVQVRGEPDPTLVAKVSTLLLVMSEYELSDVT